MPGHILLKFKPTINYYLFLYKDFAYFTDFKYEIISNLNVDYMYTYLI